MRWVGAVLQSVLLVWVPCQPSINPSPSKFSTHATPCVSFLTGCQVLCLWEALWAGPPGLHLYLCVAVLMRHRRIILG